MKKMNKMYLVLGDWSNDGHGHYDKILVESNVSVKEVQNAYKSACKLTEVSFNINEDYTETKRDWQKAENYQIATGYEEPYCPGPALELLKKHGLTWKLVNEMKPTDEFYEYEEEDFDNNEKMPIDEELFINLWFWFIKLANPKIEIQRVSEKDEIPCINGYWDKNLNIGFGYGLYN